MTEQHHICCEWQLDQYPWECTCGLTRPKAEWFDRIAREYEERMASNRTAHTRGSADFGSPSGVGEEENPGENR